MDSQDIIGLFEQLHEEVTGYPPMLTVADHHAARKMAQMGDGIDAIAVAARWDRFCVTLIDDLHVSHAPVDPSLSFIWQHLAHCERFVKANGAQLPPRRRPMGTVDGITGAPVIDGSPSPSAVEVV